VRVVHATVHDDLQKIEGILWPETPCDRWVDPLSKLPEPDDDLNGQRTYPKRPDRGAITWEVQPDGSLRFTTRLPERFGALGVTRHGLLANGGWTPEPLCHPPMQAVDWQVEVTLPPGTFGAVSSAVSDTVIRWEGRGERAPLAVMKRGSITTLPSTPHTLTVLSPRRTLRPALSREIPDQIAHVAGDLPAQQMTVVEGPLRRRLARAGPGMLFLSDRAYRVTPGMHRTHRVAVARGLAEALVPLEDPYDRSFVAAALATAYGQDLRGEGAQPWLKRTQWLPSINRLLSSQRTPFYADVLEHPHPSDPIQDDLMELMTSTTPGTVVATQIDDLYGPGTAHTMAQSILSGAGMEDAALAAGVNPAHVFDARVDPGPQDYRLSVSPDGLLATIEREARADAPPEVTVVSVDGQRSALRLSPLEPWTFPLAPTTKRVILDPDQHLKQTDRVHDQWPRKLQVSAAGGVTSVDLTSFHLVAMGWTTLRWQWDTRRLWIGRLVTDRTTLIGAHATYLHKVGPLLDGWTRPHRLFLGVGSSLLAPSFASQDAGQPTMESNLGYAYDDRVSTEFPQRGLRLSPNLSGGVVPASGNGWLMGSMEGVYLLPFSPRWVLAHRASASASQSDVPHRKLAVGGPGTVLGLPALAACEPGPSSNDEPCARLAHRRAVGGLELRWVAIRGASVPFGLAWGTDLQVSLGLESLIASTEAGQGWATGWTVGLSGVGDVLGVEPMLVGLTAGWVLSGANLDGLEASPGPELLLRWGQRF
jgi:hypothetical protein